MPAIILPNRWRRQPQVPCELNPAHWVVQRGITMLHPMGLPHGIIMGRVTPPGTDNIPRAPHKNWPWDGPGLVGNHGAGQTVTYNLPVAPWPLSLVSWAAHNSITINRGSLSVSDGTLNNRLGVTFSGAIAGDPVSCSCVIGGVSVGTASTTTGYTADVFYQGIATSTSATLRTAYINGGSKGTNTGSAASMPALTQITVGGTAAAFGGFSLQMVLPWVLNDDEAAALYAEQKDNPYEILRPYSRKIYFLPLDSADAYAAGASTATASGAGIASAAMSANGAAVATAVGVEYIPTTYASGDINATGSASATADARTIAGGAASAAGAATAVGVGIELGYVSASMSAAGSATAIMYGEQVGSIIDTSYKAWGTRPQEDEEELLAIVAAMINSQRAGGRRTPAPPRRRTSAPRLPI